MSETVPHWDALAGEWRTLAIDLPSEPARRPRRASTRRPARHGAPRDLAGLSGGSPIPEDWRYTAFAPADPLADMRRHIPVPVMKTHRPAVVMPADPGSITVTR